MNQRFLEFDAAKLPLQKLNRMPLTYTLGQSHIKLLKILKKG
ncbi:hypothetical protein LDG_5556 [Legionella drancourtii LLAP12]|uniref:Uncharacterized protein n=1 Tax=Legionella drancourtii LLAP12 TaxID=658187 RepID=G9EK34_9GAMM|nr:hypothetical protein LDG_5556 [Legionella drancourtii LLAP12]